MAIVSVIGFLRSLFHFHLPVLLRSIYIWVDIPGPSSLDVVCIVITLTDSVSDAI